MTFVSREFCRRLAETLAAVPELREARVIVEDMADVDAAIQRATVGVVIAIATTGHTRGNDASLAGRLDFEILCAEKPKVNRAGGRRDFLSQGQAAEIVAATLDHLQVEGFGTVVYDAMDRRDEGDLAQTAVTLHAEQSLDPAEALCWGLADGLQAYGRIVTRRIQRQGAVVFEPDRRGNDRYVGVRNRHLAVDITANVVTDTDDFPEIGDVFTCPVKGVRTAFRCTLSESTEGAGERTQIHLAGRTLPAKEKE